MCRIHFGVRLASAARLTPRHTLFSGSFQYDCFSKGELGLQLTTRLFPALQGIITAQEKKVWYEAVVLRIYILKCPTLTFAVAEKFNLRGVERIMGCRDDLAWSKIRLICAARKGCPRRNEDR